MPSGNVRWFDMKKMTLLICIMLIIGCGTSFKLAKPGMMQEQWDQDYYECNLTADQAIGYDASYRTALGNAVAFGTERQRQLDSCYKAKGYQEVSEEE